MAATARGDYKMVAFPEGAFPKMLEHLAAGWGGNIEALELKGSYSYGSVTENKDITRAMAESIKGIEPPLERLTIFYREEQKGHSLIAHHAELYSNQRDVLSLFISADDMIGAQNLLNQVASTLNLTPFDSDSLRFSDEILEERIEQLESRVAALERVTDYSPLKCFFSYRFPNSAHSSDRDVELIARDVEQFLSLLGVKVISGLGYEPRRVEDKVRDRLLGGVDFVVYIVTSEGESSWLRDELATAAAYGVIPVPLVEEGCNLDYGIHGNIEHIPFAPGHPGDSWIRLLQALDYIAEVKNNKSDKEQEKASSDTDE